MRVTPFACSAMLAAALALPAEAQVSSAGPAYHGQRPPMVSPNSQSYGAPIPAPGEGQGYRGAPPQRTGGPSIANGPQANGSGAWQGGRWVSMPPRGPVAGQPNHQRWGGMINGRWYAGVQAPGGWKSYHRMGHGDRLPGYWLAASFVIADYLAWGLAAPPYGYHWARYYDDAVLIDNNGRVWDSVGGIGWANDSYADDYAYAEDYGYGAQSYSESHASVGAGYPPPTGDPRDHGWGGRVPPAAYAPPPAPVQVYGGGYSSYAYSAGGTSVTVINIPGPVTTTTTTTEQVVTSYRTVRKAAARHVVRASSCCACGCR